jgi:hypothetical protein
MKIYRWIILLVDFLEAHSTERRTSATVVKPQSSPIASLIGRCPFAYAIDTPTGAMWFDIPEYSRYAGDFLSNN